ncbi:MAG: DUF2165 family protein [Bosea sp. (in: a-proteobacteria)]
MTLPVLELIHLKALIVAGLAAWLSLAVTNNILDFGTNRFLLSKTTTMQELKDDANLGRGLIGRAVEGLGYPGIILRIVIVLQIAISLLLWRGAVHLAMTTDYRFAIGAANLGLAAFLLLWFWFLIGGLYYAYWMKMLPVQQVHFTLVIITLGAMILVNMP